MVDGPDSAWRNRAPGPHRNTARQAMDGLWTEARGQQTQSNDPANNQHNPQYANYWAPRTRKRHQQEHRPQRPTERRTRRNMRRDERGTVQGPVKEQQPDGMSHRGGGGGCVWRGRAPKGAPCDRRPVWKGRRCGPALFRPNVFSEPNLLQQNNAPTNQNAAGRCVM